MAFGGVALRSVTTFIYGLAFCCAGIILGVYSYFLAVLADRSDHISNDWKAVEGLSGAAVVYTIFAVVLTCFLSGVKIFAFLGILLDVLFCGAMIAVAILLRKATNSCSAPVVFTPIGTGNPNAKASGFGGNFGSGSNDNVTYVPHLGLACRLNKAAFAVSIIAAFLFAIAVGFQLWTARHAQKDKKYGPSPANNYTSGRTSKKFWQRRRGPKTTKDAYGNAETGTATGPMLMADRGNNRVSGETGYTGTTMGGAGDAHYKPDQAGYHTGPTGTGVNPYGYQNGNGANF